MGLRRKGTDDLLGYNLIETVASPYGDKEIKYALWFKKQDGSETKAFTQFKEKGVQIGFKIDVGYKEGEKTLSTSDRKRLAKENWENEEQNYHVLP